MEVITKAPAREQIVHELTEVRARVEQVKGQENAVHLNLLVIEQTQCRFFAEGTVPPAPSGSGSIRVA